METKSLIPVGISACLMGHSVRYNGGESPSKFCIKVLSDYFDFTTFCPEVAAGFGIPRPTMRLVGDPDNPILAFSDGGGEDLTQQLRDGFEPVLPGFAELDGYILMKNSPSCGMERIKVYQENGYPSEQRRAGLFAEALQKRYPLLPVEEDGRLNDPGLRENFILRVYAHHYFRHEVLAEPSYHKLLAFHSRYKYTVMAHSYAAYRELGRMLADSHNQPLEEVLQLYAERFFTALRSPANHKGHANVLLHILGYLKKNVDGPLRQDIVEVVDRYRLGLVPLIAPITLIRHYIEQYGTDYIKEQRYLQPYPDELGLRNRL